MLMKLNVDAKEADVCLICKRGHIDDLLQAGKLFRLYFNDGRSGNQKKIKIQTESEKNRNKVGKNENKVTQNQNKVGKHEKKVAQNRHKTGNVTPSDIDGRIVKIILEDVLKSFQTTKESVDSKSQITFDIRQIETIKKANKNSAEIVVSEILEDILNSPELGNGFQNKTGGSESRSDYDGASSASVATSDKDVPNHDAAKDIVKQILLDTFNSLELDDEYRDKTELDQRTKHESSHTEISVAPSDEDVPNHEDAEDIVKQILLDTLNSLELDNESSDDTKLVQRSENENIDMPNAVVTSDKEVPDHNVAGNTVTKILNDILMSLEFGKESRNEINFDQRSENAKAETVATCDKFDQDIAHCIVKHILHETLMSLELKETPHSKPERYFLNKFADEKVKVEHRENNRKRKLDSDDDSDETEIVKVKAKKQFSDIETLFRKSGK